jgi:hypothetical protein
LKFILQVDILTVHVVQSGKTRKEEGKMLDKGRLSLAVAAGRSGLYLKGPGYLHRLALPAGGGERASLLRAENPGALPGFWCCLGILSDVAVRFGLQIPREIIGGHHYEFGTCSSYMPGEVAEWYGFTPDTENAHANGLGMVSDLWLINPDGDKIRASGWNDDDNSTFEEIFDGFERTFLLAG